MLSPICTISLWSLKQFFWMIRLIRPIWPILPIPVKMSTLVMFSQLTIFGRVAFLGCSRVAHDVLKVELPLDLRPFQWTSADTGSGGQPNSQTLQHFSSDVQSLSVTCKSRIVNRNAQFVNTYRRKLPPKKNASLQKWLCATPQHNCIRRNTFRNGCLKAKLVHFSSSHSK